jgi:sortase (surface protein transpeptidase)
VGPARIVCLRRLAAGLLRIRYGGRLDLPEAREPGARPPAARSAGGEPSARQRSPPPAPVGAPADADGLIGRIEIPRLLLSAVVVEGVDKTTLRRAVGHIPGTALPGHPGNVGLAGHRDTFFRPLKDLKIKDEIQLSTLKAISITKWSRSGW